ncbi:MAG: hypothetical protein J0652_02670 [Desulfobulbaceae bacterium]|nr:hypothetical protein [Desulfobulbaceae bacterium]
MLTVSVCPLTMGAITSMTDAGFNRSCRVRNKDQDIRNGYGSSVGTSTIYDEYCKQCGGEYPPELTIIKLKEIDMGTVTSYQGTCEMCLKPEKTLRKVLDKKCCATCEHIRRAAHKSPDLLIDALKDANEGDFLDQLSSIAAESNDYKTLKLQLQASKAAVETITGINETLTADYANLEQMVKDLRECNSNLQVERMEMLDNIYALKSANGRLAVTVESLEKNFDALSCEKTEILKENLSLIQEIEQLKQSGLISGTEEETKAVPSIFTPMPFDGYEALSEVLHAALTQAAIGKGKERHADNKPFEEQDICTITRSEGHGFTRGQARKKIAEAKRLDRDAAIRELLGAINYLAADIIVLGEVA